MKQIIKLTTLFILLLSLAACSNEAEPTPTAVPPTAPPAAAEPAATAVPESKPTAAPESETTETETAAPSETTENGLPPADIVNDEGGPTHLTGSIEYTDFSIPEVMQSPSPTLLDMVHVVQSDNTQFAPLEGQILGQMTSPVSPPPLSYAISLPELPAATYLDVDNDGEQDQGVQIFRLAMASNIIGSSYLEQLDQKADLNSYLVDPVSGNMTNGSLLIYAADDQQGFPGEFGDDGILFTADDTAVGIPQGYTVVHFGPDGFTFDRSHEAELNVLEAAQAASPDFSDQGMVAGFNSLIDHLSTHYSFTDLRQLDWEAVRAQYLPMVEQAEGLADAQPDLATAAYATILHRMAQDIRDAHVQTAITDPAQLQSAALARQLQNQPIAANIGANTVELDDGRIIITEVAEGSPASEAGLDFGTEVVAVNGKPAAELLPDVIYNQTVGTEAAQRLHQVANLLKFPGAVEDAPIADVTIDVKLPGADAVQSVTMTPGVYALYDLLASPVHDMPISFQIQPTYGYLTWDAFAKPGVRMAVLEEFLSKVNQSSLENVIIDLRGNHGGWDNLYFTMASYFFNAENPVSMHWIDMDVYDPESNDLVREAPDEHMLSAPKPELTYDGNVVVLVDNNCASSCEFFTQFLQTNQRATVIAQYGSKGAGAPINRVAMPNGITFQYTKGRSYFAGTEEFNLEAKGVTPDIKLPVTEESEQAKLQGGDIVLQAGVGALAYITARASVESINMVPLPQDDAAAFTAVIPEGWTFNDLLKTYMAPDQRNALGYYTPEVDDVNALLTALGISDSEAASVDTREANGLKWSIYQSENQGFANRTAVAQTDGKIYVIQLLAPPEVADMMQTAVLIPAVDAFVITP